MSCANCSQLSTKLNIIVESESRVTMLKNIVDNIGQFGQLFNPVSTTLFAEYEQDKMVLLSIK